MAPYNNDTPTAPPVSTKPVLADPKIQALFVQQAPNALHPSFKFKKDDEQQHDKKSESQTDANYNIVIQQAVHQTGLINAAGNLLNTTIWGYGSNDDDESGTMVSWPGKTFEVKSHKAISINWSNQLIDARGKPLPHLLPVDESLHWCYSLKGYENVTLAKDGVPLVAHLHGGHNDSKVDGNPEYFTGLTKASQGPRFVSNTNVYDNSQTAGTLWYHDHSLGITRLNVYAGLAGFYIIRDKKDTGKHDNPLGLPAKQFELAYCIQDRQFTETGELHFPAYAHDPEWQDFIVAEGAKPPQAKGPSALAEFFGDHIVVNGKLWPKTDVEARHYRIRLLNGCDSRFMRLRFRTVAAGETELTNASAPLSFDVIGSDQGLLRQVATVTQVDFMPGERIDVVFDFSSVPANSRVIIENILGDEPFNGAVPDPIEIAKTGRRTDRIMAFDVNLVLHSSKNQMDEEHDGEHDKNDNEHLVITDRYDKNRLNGIYQGVTQNAVRTRKLGLFEGRDEFGRLMPMLGTAQAVTNVTDKPVDGAMIWAAAITENPNLGDTEIWEIYNTTGDAHPIHVHLVHFDILSRNKFNAKLIDQPVITDKGAVGQGFRMEDISILPDIVPVLATEDGPKDMVLCYPEQVTRIKMTFDKAGRYVWHCHILSHEDHEMMRAFHVGAAPS